MSGHPNLVKVVVECRCGQPVEGCAWSERTVPESLRCQQRGSSGPDGGPRCPCGHRCFESGEAFRRAVRRTVEGRWQEHIAHGRVVIRC